MDTTTFRSKGRGQAVVQLLVDNYADVNAMVMDGCDWATKNGRDEAVAVLVTKAAEMPKDKKGWISLPWGVAGKTNP